MSKTYTMYVDEQSHSSQSLETESSSASTSCRAAAHDHHSVDCTVKTKRQNASTPTLHNLHVVAPAVPSLAQLGIQQEVAGLQHRVALRPARETPHGGPSLTCASTCVGLNAQFLINGPLLKLVELSVPGDV